MKFGVVIVTYNRVELLKECISACLRQSEPFRRIIVVNNNSTDGTKEYLDKKKGVIVVDLPENVGGAGGFHVGVRVAEKYDLDYLLFIDDDAIIDLNFNKNIKREILRAPQNVSAFSGTVKTKNAIQFDHRRYVDNHFNQRDSREEDYRGGFFEYDLATFCGLYVSMNYIRKIGLPDKDFFIWLDDTEYSLRLRKFGKIRNINSSWLDHKTTVTRDTGFSWKTYYGFRNQIYILKKYYSKKDVRRYIRKVRFIGVLRGLAGMLLGNSYYKTAAEICFDAIKDGLGDKMGKNKKYTALLKLKKK